MGVHLTGVHLTGVHLTSVYLAGVHLLGVHLTGVPTILWSPKQAHWIQVLSTNSPKIPSKSSGPPSRKVT
jgi:hypothetical protein